MKRSTYLIFFISIVFLALVILISGSPLPAERVTVSGEDPGEAFSQYSATDSELSQRSAGDLQIIMLPRDVPLEMLWIPPGHFMMGRYPGEQDSLDSEMPQHEVTIAEGFWIGKYEITQAQWKAVMGNNPSDFKGDNRPVEQVSWNDICSSDGYLEKLNEVNAGHKFRLPSEAEWEYAYRAGTTTRFYWGDDPDYTEINDYAWNADNSDEKIHDVGLKLPNAWGLHDMAGNAWEWCEDYWHINYDGAPNDGSAWVDNPWDMLRLLRGGSWRGNPSRCRAANHGDFDPDGRDRSIGFRVVCATD